MFTNKRKNRGDNVCRLCIQDIYYFLKLHMHTWTPWWGNFWSWWKSFPPQSAMPLNTRKSFNEWRHTVKRHGDVSLKNASIGSETVCNFMSNPYLFAPRIFLDPDLDSQSLLNIVQKVSVHPRNYGVSFWRSVSKHRIGPCSGLFWTCFGNNSVGHGSVYSFFLNANQDLDSGFFWMPIWMQGLSAWRSESGSRLTQNISI